MYHALADKAVTFFPVRYQLAVRQFLKFGITGTIGAVIDFGTYNLLTRGFDWDASYVVFGQTIVAANNVSVFLAIMSNFILNKYWTFRNKEAEVAKQWTGYFILNVITWTLNQLLVSFFTFRVPLMVILFGSQRDNAAKALAIGLILGLNFLGSKFVIFKKKF